MRLTVEQLFSDCGTNPFEPPPDPDEAAIANLRSAVRNAALEIEAAATRAGGRYPDAGAGQQLVDESSEPPVDIVYSLADSSSSAFCLLGTSGDIDGSHHVKYVSDKGGLQDFLREPGSC